MLSALLVACAPLIAFDSPHVDAGSGQLDLQDYQAAKAKVGRDADAQVKLALWCEAHGLSAERIKHLTLATLIDPSHAAARGLLGLVSYRGKWQRPDEVSRLAANDPARKAVLREYLNRRARTPDKPEDQWKLALWCEQNELKPQAIAHLHRVVSLDPRRDAAWKRLGYRKQAGHWVMPEALAAEKVESEAQTKANKFWKPRLERLREGLFSRDKARRGAAEESMSQIGSARAAPMVWMLFARGDEAHQQVAVKIFSQIEAPGASRGLALLGVFSPSAGVRRSAIEILRWRDARDFAGLLVAMIKDPIKYKVKPVGGPGTAGELFIEGKNANYRRLYTPLAPPELLPGDELGVDLTGMPVANRVLGSHWTTGVADGSAPAQALTDPGAQAISTMLQQSGMPRDESNHVAGNVVPNVQPPQPTAGNPNQQYQVSSLVQDGVQIPIGQMMADAKNSAVVAQRQLTEDVRNIESRNAPIVETNNRVRDVLKTVAGEDFGPDRQPWEKWLVDLNGYAYNQKTSSTRQPQTFEEQVPLDYRPRATPIVFEQTVLTQVERVSHSCFGAGTPVRTLDGLRPIQDLRDGDLVMTQNTSTGALSYQPIVAVFHNVPNATYRIDLGDEQVVATGIHRFWMMGKGWTMARDIKAGDRLRTIGGIVEVKSIKADRIQPVFNLQLAGGDDFFVGRQGVLAHDNSLVNPSEKPFDSVPELDNLATRSSP